MCTYHRVVYKIIPFCILNFYYFSINMSQCTYQRTAQLCTYPDLFCRPPNKALVFLQLLDYAYPDPVVRGYAVRCLRKAKDSVILMYLLQLAQALKHENYLQCDLVDFLLVSLAVSFSGKITTNRFLLQWPSLSNIFEVCELESLKKKLNFCPLVGEGEGSARYSYFPQFGVRSIQVTTH